MSKIKVDEIESSSSKVELAPKGSGVVKVKGAGGGDGTLQMTSSGGNNAVKIKSPNHAAGRQDTLILPDNDVETRGFLRVKSVTGSGATAVGQLEFKAFPTVDYNNLDASTFTSGVIPSANMPAALPTQGAGLAYVSKATVASNSTIKSIEFDLDNNFEYLILGKKVGLDSNSNNYQCLFQLAKQDGTSMAMDAYTEYGHTSANQSQHSSSFTNGSFYIENTYVENFVFTMHINNATTFSSYFLEMGKVNSSTPNMRFMRGSLSQYYNSADYIERVKFFVQPADPHYFTTNTEIVLYKYLR